MSEKSITIKPNFELDQKIDKVAQEQREYGLRWGKIFYEHDRPKSAEISLRNPAVYLNEDNPRRLSESLKEEWFNLLDYGTELISLIGEDENDWATNTTSVEKIQSFVRDGKISERFKGSVSDFIIWSSDLFSRSIREVPGNLTYYQVNTIGMDGWSQKYLSGQI